MKNQKFTKQELEKIWSAVPPDYYQKGIQKNILQRMWHTNKLNAVCSLIQHSPKNILDVGCASGWFISELAKRYPNAECVGVDVYDKAIEYGKQHYPHIKFLKADGHEIPLKNKSCELVVCCEVLEHVVNPHKVLEEIRRVLSPDGYAIIEMDSGSLMFQLVWHWWTHMRHGVWEHAHIQEYNAKKLETHILKAQLRILKKKYFNFGMAVAFLTQK
ncbi:MAG: class I SAM-dependent methyltransferase [Patescibacteria group bacterium]|nr:class I SAM-dependent methyltransferase [Patescibacteria group bacterium]